MFYMVFNIIFVIIAIIFILTAQFKKNNNYNFLNKIYDKVYDIGTKHYKLLVVILFLVTIFTSTFNLKSVPYGLHVDEAGMAYDAISISKYGVDRYLNKFPVYLINYGGGQSAMYVYLATLLIKIFGYSIEIIRMPAVLLRICIFICSFFILKDEKNKLKTLTYLYLLTIVPYFIMQSRWGLDCNLLVGFLTIAICFLIQSIRKNTNKLLLFLSGIFFGLALYTYALSYIIIPILLLFTCAYLMYIKKLKFRELILLGIPIFLLAIPLMLMLLVNNGLIEEIKGIITIPLLKAYRGAEVSISNILKNVYIIKSIFSFDKNPSLVYNSIPYFGTIYYFMIPFFIIGFIVGLKKAYIAVRKREFDINCIFIFWFFSVLICQLLIKEPNINKANAIFVPIIYFATVGIVNIVKKKQILILPIIVVLFIHFGLFFHYYFYQYDKEHKNNLLVATCYLDAVNYSKELDKEHIYIERGLTKEPYIYILLDNFVSPYEYAENAIKTNYNNREIIYDFGIPKEISKDNIYIIGNKEELLKKFEDLEFRIEKFGNIIVCY